VRSRSTLDWSQSKIFLVVFALFVFLFFFCFFAVEGPGNVAWQ